MKAVLEGLDERLLKAIEKALAGDEPGRALQDLLREEQLACYITGARYGIDVVHQVLIAEAAPGLAVQTARKIVDEQGLKAMGQLQAQIVLDERPDPPQTMGVVDVGEVASAREAMQALGDRPLRIRIRSWGGEIGAELWPGDPPLVRVTQDRSVISANVGCLPDLVAALVAISELAGGK